MRTLCLIYKGRLGIRIRSSSSISIYILLAVLVGGVVYATVGITSTTPTSSGEEKTKRTPKKAAEAPKAESSSAEPDMEWIPVRYRRLLIL